MIFPILLVGVVITVCVVIALARFLAEAETQNTRHVICTRASLAFRTLIDARFSYLIYKQGCGGPILEHESRELETFKFETIRRNDGRNGEHHLRS